MDKSYCSICLKYKCEIVDLDSQIKKLIIEKKNTTSLLGQTVELRMKRNNHIRDDHSRKNEKKLTQEGSYASHKN